MTCEGRSQLLVKVRRADRSMLAVRIRIRIGLHAPDL